MTTPQEDAELRDALFTLWRAGRDGDDRYDAVGKAQQLIKARDEQRDIEHERDLRDARRIIATIVKQEGGRYYVDRAYLTSVDEMDLRREEYPPGRDGILFTYRPQAKETEKSNV